MDIVGRFQRGVHKEDECGTNHEGFAAIGASMQYHYVHKLTGLSAAQAPPRSPQKKVGFTGQDTALYLFLRLLVSTGVRGDYLILLSRPLGLTKVFHSMVDRLNENGHIVTVVTKEESSYLVRIMLRSSEIQCRLEGEEGWQVLQASFEAGRPLHAMCYPTVLPEYESLLGSKAVHTWLVPASPSQLYVAEGNRYDHYTYPWSRTPSGYTIGNSTPREGGAWDVRAFQFAYNHYESFVSSVPYANTCVDCYALRTAGDMIASMLPDDYRRSSRMSEASVSALSELESKIEEALAKAA